GDGPPAGRGGPEAWGPGVRRGAGGGRPSCGDDARDREPRGEERGETERDRLAARSAVADQRRGERHREDNRESVQDVERLARRPRGHKDQEAEGALRDRRDHGDGDRAAKAGGGTGVANTEEEPPQPDRRVVKDECCSGAPVEREN